MRMARLFGARHGGIHLFFFLAALSIALCSQGVAIRARVCRSDYAVKNGKSLADIATRAYGSASQWTLIFYANQDRMGANASLLVPGLTCGSRAFRVSKRPLRPCRRPLHLQINPPQRPAPRTPSSYLQASENRVPYRKWLTPLATFTAQWRDDDAFVSSAMDLIKEQSGGSFGINVSWVNDSSAHLNPLLITRAFDVGSPGSSPIAVTPPISPRTPNTASRSSFSRPALRSLTVLFVKANSPIIFAKDEEILGKTLCQPAGFSTYELDKGGRNWVKENKITLMRPQTIEECFRLLDSGSVGAVVTSDLTGKAVATALGIGDRVKALQRPIAIGTLHMIVPKTQSLPPARCCIILTPG